jgi:hypothetical protein
MVLVFAGQAATEQADVLVPALCASIGDDEADIASRILACVHIFGSQVDVRIWLPLALDHLGKSQQTVAQVASCLVVLSGLLHAAAKWRHAVPGANAIPATLLEVCGPCCSHKCIILQHLSLWNASLPSNNYPFRRMQRTANVLASEDIRSLDHLAVQQQLLAATTNLVKVAGTDSAMICLPLLSVLLQLKTDTQKTVRCAALGHRLPSCLDPKKHLYKRRMYVALLDTNSMSRGNLALKRDAAFGSG